jgi:DNA-binding transcriptional ArsR family regulator
MDALFDVLAEPNRRRILDLLRAGPRPVTELVDAIGLTQPAVSKHLRILREAGLVDVTPVGRRHLYALRAEPLRELDSWLADYRSLWEARMERLDAYLQLLQGEGRAAAQRAAGEASGPQGGTGQGGTGQGGTGQGGTGQVGKGAGDSAGATETGEGQ